MKVKELIEELLKVEDKEKEVYILDNGSGEHLKLRDIELYDQDEFWPENSDGKEQYPLLICEE